MKTHEHVYTIPTAQGNIAVSIPYKVPKKTEKNLKLAVQTILNESRPVGELVDYIKTLTPTAGTPRGALRGYLAAREWTQSTLSQKTGISPAHLSEMMAGKRPIGPRIAKKLGKVLEVDYRRFL